LDANGEKEPSAAKRPLLPLFDQSPDVILAESDAFDFAVAEEIFELTIGDAVNCLGQEEILDEDHQQQCDNEIPQ
jgi:hypothetical protein